MKSDSAATIRQAILPSFVGKPRQLSLRVALHGLLLASVLPLVLVAAAFLWRQWDLQRTAVTERLRDRAQSLALAVDRELAASLALLETLAVLPEIDKRDWASFNAVATAATRSRPFSWVVLMEASGQAVVNTRAPPGAALPNLLQLYSRQQEVEWQGRHLPSFSTEIVQAPIRSGRPIFSGLFYGPVVRRPVLAAAVPVVRDGRVVYSLGIGLVPDALVSLLANEPAVGRSIVTILDGKGRVIARSREPWKMLGMPALPPFDQVSTMPPQGSGKGVNLEGTPVVYAYTRLSLSDWTVIVATPQREAYAGAYQTLIFWLLPTLVLIGLSLYLTHRLWRLLARPLTVLAQSADAMEAGRMPVVPATPIREIGTLSRALELAAQSANSYRAEQGERLAREEKAKADAQRQAAHLAAEVKERIEAEAELEQSRSRLAAILDSLSEGVVVFDLAGNVLEMNPVALALHGYADPQDVRKRAPEFAEIFEVCTLDGDVVPVGEWPLARVLRGESFTNCEFRVLRQDVAVTKILSYSGNLVRDARGEVVLGLLTIRDVSRQKEAEWALRDSEAQQRIVIENLAEGLIVVDPLGNSLHWNRKALAMHGYARMEELLSSLDEIGQHYELSTPDGEILPFEAWPLRRLLRGDVIDDYELLLRNKVAGWQRAFSYGGVLVRDGNGKPVIGLLTIRDVTERRRMEDELRESERLLERRVIERTAELQAANQDLEAFSYSVSHDLRGPLRAINGFSRILADNFGPQLPADAQRYLALVHDNTVKMSRLIDDLLAFARLGRQALKKQPISLDDTVRQCLEDLKPEWDGRQVSLEIAPLGMCEADPALLKQVFINLLSNALKYSRHSNPARIEVGRLPAEDGQVLFVRDNGVGFDPRYADKLFGVFQRLHRSEDFEGIGVGLAIVQRIVSRHGGRVWAESEPGKGATFYLSLPAAHDIQQESV